MGNLQNAYIIIYERKDKTTSELLNEYQKVQEETIAHYLKETEEQTVIKNENHKNNEEDKNTPQKFQNTNIKEKNQINKEKKNGNIVQNQNTLIDQFNTNEKELESFHELQKEIKHKNMKYFLIKNIFTSEFVDFVYEILVNGSQTQKNIIAKQDDLTKIAIVEEIANKSSLKLFEFGAMLFYTTIIRMYNKVEQNQYFIWISSRLDQVNFYFTVMY